MATKKKTNISKKSVSSARPRSYSDLYKDDKTVTPQVSTTPTKKVATVQPVAAAVQPMNWREEYAHVVRDVRTLLLVSAVLFAIIIIIGFFV